jgi:hypothetical protein
LPVGTVKYFVGATELTTATTPFAPGTYTVDAVLADGYAYNGEGDPQWILTIDEATGECDEPPTLAATGSDSLLVGGGAAFLLLGLGTMLLGRRKVT